MLKVLAVSASLVLLHACSRADAARRLTITGSSTVAPLVLEIGKRFEAQNPGVRVDVQSGGSSRGMADARKGLADLGMVSRALKADENDLTAFPLARDGLCMIVHRTNPIAALSDAQVVAIYTGATTNWRDVGGRDAPISVVNKADGRSTLELFVLHFKLDPKAIQAHVVIGDNAQGIKTVAGNPDAIGYVSVGAAEYDARQGTAIKALPMAGIAATVDNVRNGSFPLARPLNLVASKPPADVVREFLDFAQSAKVHDLVQEQFFVPLGK